MRNTKVTLVPLTADDREQFILDNQWAFKYGAMMEGLTLAETVTILFDWILTDGLGATLRELGIGWLFALLGIGKMLIETFEATAKRKITRI